MKRFFIRWHLLNKRLFKKPVFILILCSVPILILALNAVTADAEGFVRIALAAEDPSESISAGLMDSLVDSSELVYFSVCETPAEAEDRVRYGEADAAWIFSANIRETMTNLAYNRPGCECVTVVEREDTVALKLAREKLTSSLMSESGLALLCKAYAENVSPDYDEAALREHFNSATGVGEVFEYRYTSGEIESDSGASYLMLPIRGVLAAAILLCGFAMAIFWLRDEEAQVFCHISRAARPAFEFGYHLTGIADIAVIVILSLYAAGLAGVFWREAASMALYALNCAAFVILIRRLLRRASFVAAVTPLIIIAVLVVNPILFNLPFVYPLRVMTPVYYYLQAVHDPAFLWYGAAYFGVVAAIDAVLYAICERFDLRAS